MVFILGASSLHHSLQKWSQVTNRQLFENIIAVPGLNLHPGSKAKLKVVQNRLVEIPVGETIILWHDVINNSITKHPSDSRQPLNADELITVLQKIRVFINGIVYCQKKGAANVFEKLCSTGIPTLHIIKDLLSKKKQKDTKITSQYSELHQYWRIEIKTLTTVRKYHGDLKQIKQKKQRPSKIKREKGLK